MADQSMNIKIGTSFNGEGVAASVKGMKSVGTAAKASAVAVTALSKSFGGMDASASRAVGSIGRLFGAFANGNGLGAALVVITGIVSAFAEMKRKADEAAKTQFDNQIKGLEDISKRADDATESYKKLAKSIDNFKKSLLGVGQADLASKMTQQEIDQEKMLINGDKVGAAQKGVEIAKTKAEQQTLKDKENFESAQRAEKEAEKAYKQQQKATNDLRDAQKRYAAKVDELSAKLESSEGNNKDAYSQLSGGMYKNNVREELIRFQKLQSKAEQELAKAEEKELLLRNESVTAANNRVAAEKEYQRAKDQAQLTVLKAEKKLADEKNKVLKAAEKEAQKTAKEIDKEAKDKKKSEVTSLRKQNSLAQQVGQSNIDIMSSQNQTKVLEAKLGGASKIVQAKLAQQGIQDEQRARVELAKQTVENAKKLERVAKGTDYEEDATNERVRAESNYAKALADRQLALEQARDDVSKAVSDQNKLDAQGREKREKEEEKKRQEEIKKLQKQQNDLLEKMNWEMDEQTGVIRNKKTGVIVNVSVDGKGGGDSGNGDSFNDPYYGRDRSEGPASNNTDNGPWGGSFAKPKDHRKRWAQTHKRQADALRAMGIDPETGKPFVPKKDEVVTALDQIKGKLDQLTAK